MRDLHTLIKMQKLYLDQQRRVLAQKQEEADALTMAIATLQANLEMERLNADANEEGKALFGTFVKSELIRQKKLQRSLARKEHEVEVEREKLSVLFEEFKRYEIAQENWDREQREEAMRRENLEYDEQAGQRHHRKKT
jgi:hypothetical protein